MKENEIEAEQWEYSEEFKAELDRRYEYYVSGGKMVNAESANEQIRELIKEIKKQMTYGLSFRKCGVNKRF